MDNSKPFTFTNPTASKNKKQGAPLLGLAKFTYYLNVVKTAFGDNTEFEVMMWRPNLLTIFCKMKQFEITLLKDFDPCLDKQVGSSFQ